MTSYFMNSTYRRPSDILITQIFYFWSSIEPKTRCVNEQQIFNNKFDSYWCGCRTLSNNAIKVGDSEISYESIQSYMNDWIKAINKKRRKRNLNIRIMHSSDPDCFGNYAPKRIWDFAESSVRENFTNTAFLRAEMASVLSEKTHRA